MRQRSAGIFGRYLFRRERYHQGPTPLGGPSREQRRETGEQRSSLRRRLTFLAAGGVAAILIYQFGFIRQIEVGGGLNRQDADRVEILAGQYLDRTWYAGFKPFSDVGRLAGSIELADSRFSGTVAETPWFDDKLIITSEVRQAAARWQSRGDSQTYLVDEQGVVYRDAHALADAADLPLINDTVGISPQLGQPVIGKSKLAFVIFLDDALDRRDIHPGKPRSYQLVEPPREIRLSLSGVGYHVRFTVERAAADQAKELAELLGHLGRTKASVDSYIDLRIDDTAYYR